MNRLSIAVAWRFLTVVFRRHSSKLTCIAELHPGGGQYDVRALLDKRGASVLLLNLRGSLQVGSLKFGRDEWPRRLGEEGFGGMLEQVDEALNWHPEAPSANETAQLWSYRFISAFLQATALHRPRWTALMEIADTSGMGGGDREYRRHFPGAAEAFGSWAGPKLYDSPGYFFWCLLKDEEPTLLVDTSGRLWSRKGEQESLLAHVRASGGRTWEMMTRAAGRWLE